MPPSTRAISGSTALLGHDLEPVEDAVVVFEGARIVDAGPSRVTSIPDAAEIVDGSRKTLMPGFIDAHVHIGFYDPPEVVTGGVTTVRDLGWPPERISPLVSASLADGFAGPAIVAAGPMLTAPGGYPTRAAWAPQGTGREVSHARAGRAAVFEVADAGYQVVKVALNPPVGPVLDTDTLSAIVEEAHALGLKVTAHVYGLQELHKAIATGVDELAHMLLSDETIPQPTIDRMVSAGMAVVPTLAVFAGSALDTAIANLRAFRAAGGLVIYGTDLGNEGPQPGIDVTEVRAMSLAGMNGKDIIRSATVDSAAWLGLDSSGVIAEGFDADLVLVDGDPLADPSCLTRIAAVWRRGEARE